MRRAALDRIPGGERLALAACLRRGGIASAVLALSIGALLATAQDKGVPADGPEEKFEAVDPYTKGDKAALTALGLVSFGPFPWSEGKNTADVRQSLGDVPILWVETAHFKLGSALTTYDVPSDKREKEKLNAELEALKAKLPRLKLPKKQIDPWLRLHLYAQRLEAIYADYAARFSLRDEDFPAGGSPKDAQPYMGKGPYLGQKYKFAVLLTQKRSTLGRYTQETFGAMHDHNYRFPLPGGGVFFGLSAEALKEGTRGLDSAIQCATTNGVAQILTIGVRDSYYAVPMWFREGLGCWYARRIDPRWNLYGGGTESSGERDDDAWKWDVRVRRLVEQGVFTPWADTLAWNQPEQISQRMYLILWSRVDFLLQRKDTDLKAWLMGVSVRLETIVPEEVARIQVERQAAAFLAGMGRDVAALDEEWKAWVLATYPKK